MLLAKHFICRHWSVNGRFLDRNLTGVDRYTLEILRAIDSLISERHPLAAGLALNILSPGQSHGSISVCEHSSAVCAKRIGPLVGAVHPSEVRARWSAKFM
jgi:hypothetical protein